MSHSTTQITKLSPELLEEWANDPKGPVALHLRQRLLAVDAGPDEPAIIFPPTYANVGYNIDPLPDGRYVALVDSVGSQANRLEPVFKTKDSTTSLVPQITIELPGGKDETEATVLSLLDLAHRAADAVVQSSPKLLPAISEAFQQLQMTGNCAPLCAIAPTSFVFGVWDSRGGTAEKRPRLVRSVIRAWDVTELKTHSQFNSVWKKLSEQAKSELETESSKKGRKKPSVVGLQDAPAEGLGGVIVHDRIERDVTVNLVALRALRGKDDEESKRVREYILGLCLTAATADIDLYLREGCHLRYSGDDEWSAVPRRGTENVPVDLTSDEAQQCLSKFTLGASQYFRSQWPEQLNFKFDLNAAKKLLSKQVEED